MIRTMTSISFAVLFCVTSGCGSMGGMSGDYSCDLQLIDGKAEQADLSLEEARESYFKRGPESITLQSNGTYNRKISGTTHSGDWWEKDGMIMIRCRSQRGKPIAKGLISEGADTKFTIRDGEFYRQYAGKNSSYEVVYKKE